MGKTNFFENEILKLSYGKTTSLTYPITPYMALFTTMPGEDGTGGVEVSGGNYARVAVGSYFPVPNGAGSITNSLDIPFGTPNANWGTAVGWGIYNSANAGQLLRIGVLNPNVPLPAGSPVTVPAGSLSSSED